VGPSNYALDGSSDPPMKKDNFAVEKGDDAAFYRNCSISCFCSTDNRNLIIYISIAVAAAVAIAAVTVIICWVLWRASSTDRAARGPLVSTSPAAVSSRPTFAKPTVYNGFTPAHFYARGYSGYYNNGYRGNKHCYAHHPHPRCFHSRVNVYSDPFTLF